MSGLVDLSGKPVRPQLDEAQIIRVFTTFQMRMDAMNSQLTELGLFLEFVTKHLEDKGFDIPYNDFPEFAKTRFEELKAQADQMMKSRLLEQVATEDESGNLDLNE